MTKKKNKNQTKNLKEEGLEIIQKQKEERIQKRRDTIKFHFQKDNGKPVVGYAYSSTNLEGLTRQEALYAGVQFLKQCQKDREASIITKEEHEFLALKFLDFLNDFIKKADLGIQFKKDTNYYFNKYSQKYKHKKLKDYRLDVTINSRMVSFIPSDDIWSRIINAFNEYRFNQDDTK